MSNGYGEDKAAACIAGRLVDAYPSAEVMAAPLVTEGECYSRLGIPLLTHGKSPPSGGFPLKSVRGFVLDLSFVHRYAGYCARLRHISAEIDRVVAVGDVSLLTLAYLSFRKPILFVDLAKSTHKGHHYRIEESLMRRLACEVLTRDDVTREDLEHRGINARYLGNPMMDGIVPMGISLGEGPIVGILPGSRSESPENLLRILLVVERLPAEITFACALPACVSVDRAVWPARAKGWVLDDASLRKNGRCVRMTSNGFADVILNARVVIGLAGSANEQAAGLGVPVVSFAGCGPQTTARRMRDQERLLGGAARFISDFPEGVASEVMCLLSDHEERARRGSVGASRMGPPGASKAIAGYLAREFGLESTPAMAA